MSHGSTEVPPVDGVPSPQGRYGGAPAPVRPDDLATLRGGVGQGAAMLVETA